MAEGTTAFLTGLPQMLQFDGVLQGEASGLWRLSGRLAWGRNLEDVLQALTAKMMTLKHHTI